MEVLRAGSRGTPSSSSGALYRPSGAGTDEGSSNKERAVAASLSRRGEEEESVHAASTSCLGVRKTPSPRVLSHLLQFNTQRQHPAFTTTASAAAAVLLAFATAPIRAGSVPASTLSAPASARASPSPPASPAGEFGSSRSLAVASHGASTASTAADASLASTAAARLAAAAAVLTSESAIEPALRRPFTIEEETQQQLIEEEEDGAAAPTTSLADACGASANSTDTAAAALRALEETCGRVSYSTVAAQLGDGVMHHECGEAATTTPAGHANAIVRRGDSRGTEEGGELAKAAASEAAAEEASISTEIVESCAVPWKPTCLTEISFDYSVPSMLGGGAAASPPPYDTQRSTTSEPSEISPVNRATVAATSVCSSLFNRWPSRSLELPQGSAAATRGVAATRAPKRRQASITSDSDCAAAATEGMPSNVSRWRLGRATPVRQQKPHPEQQEMLLLQQQQSPHGLQQQQKNNNKDGYELPLQQQLEAVLQQQQQEEKKNVLQQEQGHHVMQRLLEQHLKEQLQLQKDRPKVHEQHIETHELLQAMQTGDSLLQRPTQQRNMEEVLQQQQQQQPEQSQQDQQLLEQLQQDQQHQPQTQDLLQHEHLDAEHFFNLVVQQLQEQQGEQQQQQDLVLGGEHNIQQHNVEQIGLPQQHSGQAGVLFQKHEHQLQILPEKDDDVELQQQQQQPAPLCADLLYEASLQDATAAARVLAAPAAQTETRPAATAVVTPVAGALAPATVSTPHEAEVAFPTAIAAGDILAAAAAAAAAATADRTGTVGAAACRQRYTQPRSRRRKRKSSKGGRFVQTSSSGYPGVSWNRRMGAWLAFYYDTQSRRSRTFHPRYFNGDIEATRIAAIEFKKSMDRLFSSASNTKEQDDTVSLESQQQQNPAQNEQPQEEGGQEEPEQVGDEQEESPQPQHLLDVDLGSPSMPEWAASLLLPQHVKSQPARQEQQEKPSVRGGAGGEDPEREGSSSSRLHSYPRYSSIGDTARDAVTVGRKRGREDDVGEKAGAATAGREVSPCFTLPEPRSVTDLASALLPAARASTELLTLGGDPEASCTNGAAAAEQSAAPAAAALPDASTVHEEAADSAALSSPVKDDTDREMSAAFAAGPLQASSAGATISAAAVSSPLGVDLSVLAAMGSPERLQKVLSFGTDLPGTSAGRLAFSWSRLSTLSTENLNVLYRRSRSNMQLLGQGAGAPCPAAGGPAGAVAEDAAREGCKPAVPTISQLLRQVQEEEEKEDEQNLSIPFLLQQLQLNEGAAAASISGGGVHLDDAALLRGGEEELHRILEQSCGLLSFPFLWRGEMRFSDSKEAYPEASTRSRVHDENSSTPPEERSVACSSSGGSSGADSASDSVKGTSSSSNSKNNYYSGDRTNSTDGASQTSGGIATNGNSSNRGAEDIVAFPGSKSGESFNEAVDQDAQTNSLEKICRLLGEGEKEQAGEEKQSTIDRASCLPYPARAQYTGGNFCADTSPSEFFFKKAVNAFQLNRRKSGVVGEQGVASASCQRRSSNSNSITTHAEVL